MTLNTNVSSLQAQRRLGENTSALQRVSERLASGLRITRAADDAAGLAIASGAKADTRVLSQAIRNVNDGLGLAAIAEGALRELSGIATRQLELAEQAANGTYSLAQRRAMDQEANALVAEHNRIVHTVTINGLNLLDGSLASGLRLQAGYGENGGISFGLTSELAREAGDGTFETAVGANGYGGGGSNYGLDMGLINGDQFLDLVMTSTNGPLIAFGNGDGTFTAPVSLGGWTGINSWEVDLVDLNNDNLLDIVTADATNGGVFVYRNTGNGTFAPVASYAAGAATRDVTQADVNGDGILDLVTANSTTDRAHVLLGNGDGTFRSPITTNVGYDFPETVVLVDMDGDGIKDLVGGDGATIGGIQYFKGNGDGTFRAGVTFLTNATGSDFVLADLNHDGIEDLTVVSYYTRTAHVFVANGNGTFAYKGGFNAGGGGGFGTYMISTGDYNGDGIVDLASIDSVGAFVGVMLGNNDGSFQAATTFASGATYKSLVSGDVNSDGVDDLAILDFNTNQLWVHLGGVQSLVTLGQIDLLSQENARSALTSIRGNLNRINSELGQLGAIQSRLSVAANNLAVSTETISAVTSRILDADVAEESADLVRRQILQQASAAILAQANQQPALALTLLRSS